MRLEKELTIDCSTPNRFKATVGKQGDKDTRFFKVTITKDGEKQNVNSGEAVLINCKRADGEKKAFSGEVNQDNTVTVPLPNWLLEKEGDAVCDISILDMNNETRLTTLSFSLYIEKAVYNTSTPSEDEKGDVLIEILNELDDKVNIYQGTQYEGKVLGINSQGNVVPTDSAGGTSDYTKLSNKPSINNVELNGNKSLADLGITYTALSNLPRKTLTNGENQAFPHFADGIYDVIVPFKYGDFTMPQGSIIITTMVGSYKQQILIGAIARGQRDVVIYRSGETQAETGFTYLSDLPAFADALVDFLFEKLPDLATKAELQQAISGLNIPTKTSDLTNDSQFVDEAALAAAIASLGSVFTLKGSKATTLDLPDTGNKVGDVWYVQSKSAGYVWINDNGTQRWEMLGETVDLSNYFTKAEINALLGAKQDTLTKGDNINISNDTISAYTKVVIW